MSDATAVAPPEPRPSPLSVGLDALHEMRRTRQRHRLGDVEWFDTAYRVYMVALFGGGALLWLSGMIGDEPLTPSEADDLLRHGPAVLGLVAVLAVVMGLRSGSQGGPIALERADVVHVMLAPVDRAAALRRPAVQRVRSAIFAAAVTCGLLGQLMGRRLPGTEFAWFGSGVLFGIVVALLWGGTALVAHELRLRLGWTTVVGLALLGWQAYAVAEGIPGPANLVGSLVFWGERQRPEDALAVVAAVVLVVAGLLLLGRLSLDALERRSSLVAQLRFAVTMQDLRTVVLLRRQLAHEHTRPRPWIRLPRTGRGHPVWRRGWHSLLRIPVPRLIRIVALAVGAGACQAWVFRGTTPAMLGTTALLFLLALELLEAMSQEIDQPDRNESFPIERGEILVRHIAAPAVALIPFAILGGAATVLLDGVSGGAGVVALLAYPTALLGLAGGAVSVVRDAPDPLADTTEQMFMPPEMASIGSAMRTILPLIPTALATLPALLVRETAESDPAAVTGTAIRCAVGLLLVFALVVVWVRTRDRIHASVRGFLAEGRRQTQQQRANQPTHRSTP